LRSKVAEDADDGARLSGKIHNPVVFFNGTEARVP
jgi:hypothetical protein